MIRRSLTIALACALGAVAVLRLQSPAEAAPVDDEARFVALINELRLSEGLDPLALHPDLQDTARGWAGALADTGALSHAPDLSVGVQANWAKLGENVGVSPEGEVVRLFQAFVASPTHLENLLDDQFDSIGIGVVHRDGKLWTAQRFMQRVPTGASAGAGDPENGVSTGQDRIGGAIAPDQATVQALLVDLAQ